MSSDFDSLPDLDDYEVDEFDYPSKVELHLNIYLDPQFTNFLQYLGKSPNRFANQIVAQSNLLMNFPSLCSAMH